MRILFVTAELSPFAKVGGLGDVAAALPAALARLGVDVRIALPKYPTVPKPLRALGTFPVGTGTAAKPCSVFQGSLPDSGVPVYFVGHDPYFDRAGVYGEGGGGYPDELERFAFLSEAALGLCPAVGWIPDVVHANDWHTALIPIALRSGVASLEARSVFTIHNLAYQGWFPRERGEVLRLDSIGWQAVARDGGINLLQGAIRTADRITTVSPTYAQEILTHGEGLESDLQARSDALTGILNGIDTSSWDPARDPHLWAPYSAADPSGKRENKQHLQAELGLSDADGPLVGVVSRLAEQKGFDLMIAAFERMMALGVQFVVLGEGDPRYASFFRDAERRYPGRVRALIEFSERWAHRVEAAADIFLMPSRFEPAGLNQLYSLRYGAVPVVRATGGLRDTIRDYDPASDSGNGFSFGAYAAEAMLEALGRAVRMWHRDKPTWARLVRRGMDEDHSWEDSARRYLHVYRRVLADATPARPGAPS